MSDQAKPIPHLLLPQGASSDYCDSLERENAALKAQNEALRRQVHALLRQEELFQNKKPQLPTRH